MLRFWSFLSNHLNLKRNFTYILQRPVDPGIAIPSYDDDDDDDDDDRRAMIEGRHIYKN